MSNFFSGTYKYKKLEDGTFCALLTSALDETLIFPCEKDGIPITQLGTYNNVKVSDCVKKLIIPGTIKKLYDMGDKEVFKNIESIIIEEGVEEIAYFVFDSFENLKEVSLPNSLTLIGYRAFSYCEKLEKINIPNKLTQIGEEAFMGCSSLPSITIPFSVTKIDERAFMSCTNLININVDKNNSVYQSIDGNLLSKDGKFFYIYPPGKTATSFEIPNGVEQICFGAFGDCFNLHNVKTPDSVVSILDFAFTNCKNLKTINIPSFATVANENVFSGCNKLNVEFNTTNKFIAIFEKNGCARTLRPSAIGKHKNGWTVNGTIKDDYVRWVNYFSAEKETMWVKGDFEDIVTASSKEAYYEFLSLFPYETWDYQDI